MVKIRAIKRINYGIIERKGPTVLYEAGQEYDVPDREPYSSIILQGVEDGFLELLDKPETSETLPKLFKKDKKTKKVEKSED